MPDKVQEAAGSTRPPTVIKGTDADDISREASFCCIGEPARRNIMAWLAKESIPGFQPTLIRVSKADKDLSSISAHPTLGTNSTLPQHHATHPVTVFEPIQDQYPAWYFFYGSLADFNILSGCLSLFSMPEYRQASITGGTIKSWGAKYKALINAPGTIPVKGWAYRVVSREYEDALRLYQTEAYEVVRCSITMKGKPDEAINGLVFRFIGQA